MYRYTQKIFAGFSLVILLNACLDIQEINYIAFKADFEAPANIRQGDTLYLTPGQATEGAQTFEWYIVELNATFSSESFVFRFDSLGRYTVRLRSSIQKSTGLLRDSSQREIWVLPPTLPLTDTKIFGLFESDESVQDVLTLPGQNGYMLLGRRDVNILQITRLDQNGNEIWQSEFPNLTRGRIEGTHISLTEQGYLLVCGTIQSSPQENDAFIIQLEDQGDQATVRWQKVVSSVESESYTSIFEIIQNQDVSYYAVGTITSGGQSTIIIDRYQEDGVLKSSQSFENVCSGCQSRKAQLINRENEANLIVAGQETGSPAVFEFKIRSAELSLNNKLVLGRLRGQSHQTALLSDGKFAVVGEVESGTSDSTQAFIMKLDVISRSVVPTWISRTLIYQERFLDVLEGVDGDLWAIGRHYNPLSGEDIILCNFDPLSGQQNSVHLLGSPVNEGAARFLKSETSAYIFGSVENNTALRFRNILFAPIVLE
ncbi:MAG: hypothetical protein NW226_27435 [Microscillaceae bacterium]|nr:hypothetical protein [Microscillaceae bacterium]